MSAFDPSDGAEQLSRPSAPRAATASLPRQWERLKDESGKDGDPPAALSLLHKQRLARPVSGAGIAGRQLEKRGQQQQRPPSLPSSLPIRVQGEAGCNGDAATGANGSVPTTPVKPESYGAGKMPWYTIASAGSVI